MKQTIFPSTPRLELKSFGLLSMVSAIVLSLLIASCGEPGRNLALRAGDGDGDGPSQEKTTGELAAEKALAFSSMGFASLFRQMNQMIMMDFESDPEAGLIRLRQEDLGSERYRFRMKWTNPMFGFFGIEVFEFQREKKNDQWALKEAQVEFEEKSELRFPLPKGNPKDLRPFRIQSQRLNLKKVSSAPLVYEVDFQQVYETSLSIGTEKQKVPHLLTWINEVRMNFEPSDTIGESKITSLKDFPLVKTSFSDYSTKDIANPIKKFWTLTLNEVSSQAFSLSPCGFLMGNGESRFSEGKDTNTQIGEFETMKGARKIVLSLPSTTLTYPSCDNSKKVFLHGLSSLIEDLKNFR